MKHIAVVEDEDMMREELEAILQKAGYRTSGITDFENAAADYKKLDDPCR